MKIQKGMVKYKDRNDIVCIYGVTNEGKTYYFLNSDGKSFTNGNYIASTELVEAIDPMYKCSKVGVIDSEGKEVIPCENKSVKPITDEVILVEKAVATTESVLHAIEHRSDSLYAAQLVSTPAQIKDSIYREMGNDGRFLFNDQFAEATVYDINGNNLVNNEVYSFIAMNNEQLYLSKNVPESPVVRFTLGEKKVEETVAEEVKAEEVTAPAPVEPMNISDISEAAAQTEAKEEIDVNDVSVPMDVVEGALESATAPEGQNVIQDNFDVDIHTPLENVNEGLEIPSSDDFMAATNVGIPVVHEDAVETTDVPAEEIVEEVTEEVTPEETVAEETVEVQETTEAVEETVPNIEDVAEHVEEEFADEKVVSEEAVEEVATTEETKLEDAVPEVEDIPTEEVVEEITSEDTVGEETPEAVVEETTEEILNIGDTETAEVSENVVENTLAEETEKPLEEEDIQSLLDETSMDLFNGSSLQLDTIGDENIADDIDSYSFIIPEKINTGSLYDDVAKSLAGLIRQVREQRATIANCEELIDGLNADKAELQGKYTAVEHQNVELSDRNRTLENGVVKLKTRIEMLASKLHEKDEIIESQNRELKELRRQSEGKAQLMSLLRDAQALVNDANADEDVEDYSYIKAA